MIRPGGLLLVVSDLFAVLILVFYGWGWDALSDFDKCLSKIIHFFGKKKRKRGHQLCLECFNFFL